MFTSCRVHTLSRGQDRGCGYWDRPIITLWVEPIESQVEHIALWHTVCIKLSGFSMKTENVKSALSTETV